MTYKLLFVCLGNICRSPAAENIMKHLLKAEKLETIITCDSAGTAGYHIGRAPDPRMVAVGTQRGIVMEGGARKFEESDFSDFDLILAMDKRNYENILQLDSQGQYRHKVRMMCEFCTKYQETEVPDPYYGEAQDFAYVLDLLTDACEGLLTYVTVK